MQNALPQSGAFANCTSGGGIANRTVAGGAQVSTNPWTYATNVPGLGIRYFEVYKGLKRYWGAAIRKRPMLSGNGTVPDSESKSS